MTPAGAAPAAPGKTKLRGFVQTKEEFMDNGATHSPASAGSDKPSQALTEIRMLSFGSATNLPIWIAQDLGLFEKQGLKVIRETTRGSKMQMRDMMEGNYDIATTAFDNIVAYTEGKGAVNYDNYDMFAFLGVHSGMNSVVAAPDIKKWSDLKGKTASVDALTSGYATVLYQILKDKGLVRDRDYKVISVGSTRARLESLREKTSQVAIISSPEDLQIQADGFNILADAACELGDYQASVYATRKSWAKDHEKEIVAFGRAVIAAHDVIHSDKKMAIEVLKKHIEGVSDAEMEKMFDRMSGEGGFAKKAALSEKGIQTVLDLRAVYNGQQFAGGYDKYIDLGYARKAMGL